MLLSLLLPLLFLLAPGELPTASAQQIPPTTQNGQNGPSIAGQTPNQALGTVAEQTKQVISDARTGERVRQCSCQEQDGCLQTIQTDLNACFQSCWEVLDLGKVAPKPATLKHCFEGRVSLLDQFISCVNITAKTCWPNKQGPLISGISMQKLVQSGEQRMLSQAKSLEHTLGDKNKQLIDVLESAITMGTCMKECFMQKDAGEKCFNQNGCQPKLEERLVGPVMKRCAAHIGWKREASELCDCFLQAGVVSVKPYCLLLRGSQGSSKKQSPHVGKEEPMRAE